MSGAVWTRLHAWHEIESAIGGLISEYHQAAEWFEGGHLHAYRVNGEGYAGTIAVLFEEYEDRTMRCTVLGFAGHGVASGLSDLVKLLEPTPARRLELNAESFAHVVLYRRAGFEVDGCKMGMQLQ